MLSLLTLRSLTNILISLIAFLLTFKSFINKDSALIIITSIFKIIYYISII
jgi:hypothetical protein